jgi:2-polyprenyl-6-methoxyphenol hydroxylase-like FAD-dependent oxidoreductase
MEFVKVRFEAQVANRWVVGRTMVAGDAAHNFPPFGGQGIASGFRDSISLAWRLSLITKNPEINYEELLTGWYVERKQQVEVCMSPPMYGVNGSVGGDGV